MTALIITGHGHFASGLYSALELIVGPQTNVFPLDFTAELSSTDLKVAMLSAIQGTDAEEILILSDLAGGTPFKTSALLATEFTDRPIKVISGTNLPMLLEIAMVKDHFDATQLIQQAEAMGHQGIKPFALDFTTSRAQAEADADGI